MTRTIVPLAELTPPDVSDVYKRILCPAFRTDELLEFDNLVTAYTGDGEEPSCVLLESGRPIAVLLAEKYVNDQVLLLSYLAVVHESRSEGAGSLLLDTFTEWAKSLDPEPIIVAEVDDPRVWPSEVSTGDAHARLQFYERRGARLIPVNYFQPRIRASGHRVPGMFLIRLDPRIEVKPELTERFLVEYFTTCEGPNALEDPDLVELLRQVQSLYRLRILPPLSEWRNRETSSDRSNEWK